MLITLTATIQLFFLCLVGEPKHVKSFVALPDRAAATTVAHANANESSETPEEKEERMKLVRKIQESFYKNEGDEKQFVQKADNNCFDNVPLFRVQWTELPGYQNLLNIHVPHYTHMFRRIINCPKPWRFGHVYLPGGSENLNNPDYKLLTTNNKATRTGTLMQISDVMEDEKDGRLVLIVQAIDRFQIVGEAAQHAPYTVATVQMMPDKEETSSSKGIQDLEEWIDWEIHPTRWQDHTGKLNISPLVNYNSESFPDELGLLDKQQQSLSKSFVPSVFELEYKVWVALDEMLSLMQAVSGLEVPVPSQLLGLLPTQPLEEWPKSFQLESVASRLEENDAQIGTYTKSPFVRVSRCETYPSMKRAKRLSYTIWILLDGFLDADNNSVTPFKQKLIEIDGVARRLSAAYQQIELVNTLLRQTLPSR